MRVKLGNYISEYSVRNKSSEDIPVYSVTNTQGFCRDYFGKEVASKDKSTYKIVPRGCFAYNPSRINVGSVDWQRNEDRVIVSPLYNVFSVSDDLDRQYLYYFLKSDRALHLIKAAATGSVRDNLKFDMLCDFQINLPSLNEQKEIVYALDKIKSVILLRQQELQKLDDLIKARFVEMFGEVETNEKAFTMKRMDECCKFIGGAQPDKSHFEYEKTDDNIRLIQIRDYKSDRFITYIPIDLARKTCTAHDIMIGRYGPPIFQILGGIDGAYNVALMKAIPSSEFNTDYFRCFLKNEKLLHYLESFSQRTAGQDGIQIDKLNAYPCFVPPIELQNQFADFVKQLDKSKFVVQQALDKAQLLFDSLMQQYFG